MKPTWETNMQENRVLFYIRRDTKYDLCDAAALAEKVLANAESGLDSSTRIFSRELFMAVALEIAYSEKYSTFEDMLFFLVDPAWDMELQILYSFQYSKSTFLQKEAAIWIIKFLEGVPKISTKSAERLVKKCHTQWKAAINSFLAVSTQMPLQNSSDVQVFNSEAVFTAMNRMSGLKTEKRGESDLMLEAASKEHGYREIPDIKSAGVKLEVLRHDFENLAEPINRLQTSLVLAGCMKPDDFHMAPILLLGEPGIGKTYLASQLAQSMGVPMEKISAGGAQGGFQLTGSHSSWADSRPGLIFSLLAQGRSASPVVVIDEIDKIRDAKYPVLPVLLDLLEPETGKQFKDEFFEVKFDASKVIFILTANSIAEVPASLLSRCEVFNIPRPGFKQRSRIIENIVAKLKIKTDMEIELDKAARGMLAERLDIDLRRVNRLVEDAIAKAILTGNRVADLWLPEDNERDIDFKRPENGQRLH
jgi:ATP-dependent Lon protease